MIHQHLRIALTLMKNNRHPDCIIREIPTDNKFWVVFTARRVCIVRTMLSQDARLSVRYTHVSYRNGLTYHHHLHDQWRRQDFFSGGRGLGPFPFSFLSSLPPFPLSPLSLPPFPPPTFPAPHRSVARIVKMRRHADRSSAPPLPCPPLPAFPVLSSIPFPSP